MYNHGCTRTKIVWRSFLNVNWWEVPRQYYGVFWHYIMATTVCGQPTLRNAELDSMPPIQDLDEIISHDLETEGAVIDYAVESQVVEDVNLLGLLLSSCIPSYIEFKCECSCEHLQIAELLHCTAPLSDSKIQPCANPSTQVNLAAVSMVMPVLQHWSWPASCTLHHALYRLFG